jgi:hypothetical protein
VFFLLLKIQHEVELWKMSVGFFGVLIFIFFVWWKAEGSLDIHTVDIPRREAW